jgi:hypothetical protein
MSALTENKNTRNKGKHFNKEDDRTICRAWIAISTDPKIGTNQTNDEFWKKVKEEFDAINTRNYERAHTSLSFEYSNKKGINKSKKNNLFIG